VAFSGPGSETPTTTLAQLFAADGRLWQIDFGMGSFKTGAMGLWPEAQAFPREGGIHHHADFMNRINEAFNANWRTDPEQIPSSTA